MVSLRNLLSFGDLSIAPAPWFEGVDYAAVIPVLDIPVAACPGCQRRVFSRRHMLHARLDGTVTCGACGRTARLAFSGRWMIACAIALTLPSVLLYGGLFYSGHLFVVSLFFIFGTWRVLSVIVLPFLSLEPVEDPVLLDRRQSALIAGALLVAAMTVDGFMSSRFEDDAHARDQAAVDRQLNR